MMTIEELHAELDKLDVDTVAAASSAICRALARGTGRGAVPMNEGMIALLGVAAAVAIERQIPADLFRALAATAYDEREKRRVRRRAHVRGNAPGGDG